MPAISYSESHPDDGSYHKPLRAAPAAGPVSHLSPALQAKVDGYHADHYAPPVCPPCQAQGARELYGGRCKHRPTPAERARQVAWERKAIAYAEAQQLDLVQRGASFVPVYAVGEQLQRDSRWGRPSPVDVVSFIP